MQFASTICAVLTCVTLSIGTQSASALTIQSPLAGKDSMTTKTQKHSGKKDVSTINEDECRETRTMRVLNPYLFEGKLADGEAAMRAELRKRPKDDQARFGLGVIQFLRGIEETIQSWHRYGLLSSHKNVEVPFMRLPTNRNPGPETISYAKFRKVFERLVERFDRVEATLASIKDEDVKLPLQFGMIRMDFNGDGIARDGDTLWKIYSGITRRTDITQKKAETFTIKFDRGDVHWLRGYCHLLSAMCNIFLTYDSKESFEYTAHLLFPEVNTPYRYLSHGKGIRRLGETKIEIIDLIQVIHLMRWKVAEPKRMVAALHHLEEVVAQSRLMWKYIMAETDDDCEWIPNPTQTGVLPNAEVTDEMVVTWGEFMNQVERILRGDLLISFWRGNDGRGINMRKFFLNPPPFDLVSMIQGPPWEPYLEKGETTKIETWRSLQSTFGDRLPGFAIWFN